jgi:hypothetical protein
MDQRDPDEPDDRERAHDAVAHRFAHLGRLQSVHLVLLSHRSVDAIHPNGAACDPAAARL